MAPPNPPPRGKAPPKGGGGNVLTTRYGPLPLWAWVGIAVVGYLLYRRYSSGAASATTAATAGTAAPATETVTTPYGSYTGPAQGGIPSSVLGPGPTPGSTTGGVPGSGGNSTPSPPGGPQYALITSNVAQTVQSRLTAGQPVLYAGMAGQAAQQGQGLVPVTQPTPGGGWLFGGSPTAPGNPTGAAGAPSGYYVPVTTYA